MKRWTAILILSSVLMATSGVPMLVDLCCGPAAEQAEMDGCHSHDCCDTEITVNSIDAFATAAVTITVAQAVLTYVSTVPVFDAALPTQVVRAVSQHPPHPPPDRQAVLGVFLI